MKKKRKSQADDKSVAVIPTKDGGSIIISMKDEKKNEELPQQFVFEKGCFSKTQCLAESRRRAFLKAVKYIEWLMEHPERGVGLGGPKPTSRSWPSAAHARLIRNLMRHGGMRALHFLLREEKTPKKSMVIADLERLGYIKTLRSGSSGGGSMANAVIKLTCPVDEEELRAWESGQCSRSTSERYAKIMELLAGKRHSSDDSV